MKSSRKLLVVIFLRTSSEPTTELVVKHFSMRSGALSLWIHL